VPVSSTPEELGKVLEETYEQTERVAREFGLKVD
jgi:tripartite-type tricarboxylate transporter receptor subunit TctC